MIFKIWIFHFSTIWDGLAQLRSLNKWEYSDPERNKQQQVLQKPERARPHGHNFYFSDAKNYTVSFLNFIYPTDGIHNNPTTFFSSQTFFAFLTLNKALQSALSASWFPCPWLWVHYPSLAAWKTLRSWSEITWRSIYHWKI